MVTLSATELDKITKIKGGEARRETANLYIPKGVNNALRARLPQLREAACWNWALCGGEETNPNRASSPTQLYQNNSPFNYFTNAPRANFANNFLSEPQIGQLWNRAKRPNSTQNDRVAFMQAMGRVAARSNGLQPSIGNAQTPYKIHVTAKSHEWFSWDHWALSITHNNRTRFIQTEPRSDINWGYTRLWEADRPQNIEASFYINGIHQAHKDVILAFLDLPMCSICKVVKPEVTNRFWRWHRCKNNHYYCDHCQRILSPSLNLGWTKRHCREPGCILTTQWIK